MINIENIDMSTSDVKPITDEDILEKIKELRYRVANEQNNCENTIRLHNDDSRNEYYILFKVVTDKTRSQSRIGEVGIQIGHTVNGKPLEVRKTTRIDNLSDRAVLEITHSLIKYVELFFENAPDKKKQRPAYEEYIREMKKKTIWDKSGEIPVLKCQEFESRPQVEQPQEERPRVEQANNKTFNEAVSSLYELYHPAVVFMRLLKDYPEDFASYVTDRKPFDKADEFICNVKRDEMTIRDLYEKGVTPTHLCELLIDALKRKFDEGRNIPECFALSTDKIVPFIKDFCENVCKGKETPVELSHEVYTFITTCEGLGFSSAKSIHALLKVCYDSVDNMIEFFKGNFKWSDTLVDDAAHFIGFLQGEYGGEMNETKLLGELYDALSERFQRRTLTRIANNIARSSDCECKEMVCDGSPTPSKFACFIIALVHGLQNENEKEEDDNNVQAVDTECFAVGVKGVSLEQFERWLKYHPGASYELL